MKSKKIGVVGVMGINTLLTTTVYKIENTMDMSILDTNFTGKSGQELRRERRKSKRNKN